MTRILHTAVAFVIVTAVYLAYAATIVPLVEPKRTESRNSGHVGSGHAEGFAPELKYAPVFESLFPEGHWSRNAPPQVWEADQGMLVFGDYETHNQGGSARDDGQVTLKPCAMIYFPTPWSRGKEPPPADAIVLEAPQGCVAQFDGPLTFVSDNELQLQGAWFVGPVSIHSDMEDPGPEDDLAITTQDVEINNRRIFTAAPLQFQLGPHAGRGRMLEIQFTDEDSGKRGGVLDVSGVSWIRLQQDVRLTLRSDGHSGGGALGIAPGSMDAMGAAEGEIAVSCDGPLFIDVPRQTADFTRNVEVFFVHSNGPSDRLACESLQVAFAEVRRPGDAHAAAADTTAASLQPVRMAAEGRPVTVYSALRQFEGRCRRLVYDVREQTIAFESLTPEEKAFRQGGGVRQPTCDLRQDSHRLSAPRIEYAWDRDNPRERLGTLRISGKGTLTTINESDGADQQLAATWEEGLQLVRHEGQPVLSLYGHPVVEGPGLGRMAAGKLHVWLREMEAAPAPPGSPAGPDSQAANHTPTAFDVAPDRIRADGGVEIDAPQLTARVGQLDTWFIAAGAFASAESTGAHAATASRSEHRIRDAASGRTETYYVEADFLQIRALLTEKNGDAGSSRVEPTDLTLKGSVLLQQRTDAAVREPSAQVEADWLHAADVHTSAIRVSAKGRPVVAKVDGKALRSGEIHYDESTNQFDVPTAGDLSLTLRQDLLEQRPLESPVPVTVSWREGLHFDGTQATLTGQVHTSTPDQQLRTQRLVATLRAPVPLDRLQSDGQAEFETLECTGGVILDRRTFDEGGLASVEHAEFPNLAVQRRLGQVSAAGPGWLRRVGMGRGNLLHGGAGGGANSPVRAVARQSSSNSSAARTSAQTATSADTKNAGLNYLRVDFQRSMLGEHKTQDVTFQGQVQCVHGPVASWDQAIAVQGLGQLPEGAFVLGASTLRVGRRRTHAGAWHELEAEGGVEIEGGLGEHGIFTGRGDRLTYDERKDLVILDGGAGMAELVREESLGGKRQDQQAKTIQYSPTQRRLRADGVQQMRGDL